MKIVITKTIVLDKEEFNENAAHELMGIMKGLDLNLNIASTNIEEVLRNAMEIFGRPDLSPVVDTEIEVDNGALDPVAAPPPAEGGLNKICQSYLDGKCQTLCEPICKEKAAITTEDIPF